MNHFQALCHCLACLENPISAQQFAANMRINPLFQMRCSSPRHWLLLLFREGAVAYEPPYFQLQGVGLWLYQYLLNWPSQDRAVKQQRKAQPQQPAFEINCQRCQSRFCATHLLAGLLQRFYAGQLTERLQEASTVRLFQAAWNHLRQEAVSSDWLLNQTLTTEMPPEAATWRTWEGLFQTQRRYLMAADFSEIVLGSRLAFEWGLWQPEGGQRVWQFACPVPTETGGQRMAVRLCSGPAYRGADLFCLEQTVQGRISVLLPPI